MGSDDDEDQDDINSDEDEDDHDEDEGEGNGNYSLSPLSILVTWVAKERLYNRKIYNVLGNHNFTIAFWPV